MANSMKILPESAPTRDDALPGITRRFEFRYDNDGRASRAALTVYVTVMLNDGHPCRIVCAGNDTGSLESGLLRAFFDSITAHLARGVTLPELAPLFRGTKFEPTCMLRFDGRPTTSPIDAIFGWMCERWPEGAR
jgi:hypothetical protein